jgi:hypothetical protein
MDFIPICIYKEYYINALMKTKSNNSDKIIRYTMIKNIVEKEKYC